MIAVDSLVETGARMPGTRPAARAMESAMRVASDRGTVTSGTITCDTSGVRRIGVSFFDEALLIFNEIVAETGNNELRLVYHKAPPADSLKNLVGNRGPALSETDTGDRIIAQPAIF